MIVLLLACAVEEPAPAASPFVPLEPARLLRRMSLDLRGVTPSIEELAALEADPAALDTLRTDFLADPRLEERLVSLWAERFRMMLDEFQVRWYDYQLPPEQECAFERAVGEEPLRLLARVTVEDRPWSDIVTADTTVINDLLGGLWPIDYPEGATGWQEVHYTDGRPALGVLATNGMWLRYYTSQSNANRSRAAAIADLLLCADYLERPVTFSTSPSLADAAGTAEALRTNDACLACHSSIEPIAASLFGWYPAVDYNRVEFTTYHKEREALGPELLGVDMGYFGQPLQSPGDLGPHIASDSRFYSCATRTVASLLWRRPVEVDEYDTLASLETVFAAGDWRMRPLITAVLDTPEYRAGEVTDATLVDRERTHRLLSADVLGSAVEDLTGFAWRWNDCGQLANDDYGYRVLVGGVDGEQVTRPQQVPSLTWTLVVERLAQGGAVTAVERAAAGESGLLTVALEVPPGDPAWEEQVETLYLRLFARRPTADELAADGALWTAAGDPATGWTALLTVLLRDPEFVTQ